MTVNGPWAAVFPLASLSSTRTECCPSVSAAVSSVSVPLAESLHGTIAVYGGAQPSVWELAAVPSTSSSACWTPDPVSVAENDRPCDPFSVPPANSDPAGGALKAGSVSSASTIAARYMRNHAISAAAPTLAGQTSPASPPQYALSQMSRPAGPRLVTMLASDSGVAGVPTNAQLLREKQVSST